jgi:hypothetical protein
MPIETVCPPSIVVSEGVMVAGLGRKRGRSRKIAITAVITMTAIRIFTRMLSTEGI